MQHRNPQMKMIKLVNFVLYYKICLQFKITSSITVTELIFNEI